MTDYILRVLTPEQADSRYYSKNELISDQSLPDRLKEDQLEEHIAESVGDQVAEQDIPGRVTAAVAAAPTVVAAAEAAVDAEIVSRDIVEGGAILEPEIVFAVVDEGGRRTWIEAGPDGGLTPYSVDKIVEAVRSPVVDEVAATGLTLSEQDEDITGILFGVVDADGRRTEIEVGLDGKLTQRVIDSIAARLDIATSLPVPAVSSTDVVLIGHSMLAGASGAVTSALTGRATSSLAVGGESMATISARWGSHPTRVTFPGGVIPASGGAEITLPAEVGTPLAQGPSSYAVRIITVDGTEVAGTFSKPSGVFTFTRTTAGVEVPVTRPAEMRYDLSSSYRNRTAVFWAGRNGSWTAANAVRDRLDRMTAMIQHLQALDRRYLVLSEHIAAGDSADVIAAITDYNSQARLRWGSQFIDTQAYLIAYGLADAGLTATAQDTADIAAGLTPTSLRGDTIHLTTAANGIVAQLIKRRLAEKGW